jgi:hypothetical protein
VTNRQDCLEKLNVGRRDIQRSVSELLATPRPCIAKVDEPSPASTAGAPVYGWFTEGFDTLDLKEAKTLLDELAA